MRPSGTMARLARKRSVTEVFKWTYSGFWFIFWLLSLSWFSSCFTSGGRQHDIRSLQLQQPAEPGICLLASGAMLCGPEGRGGATGEEIPSHGHPGAFRPHWAHTDPAAEKSKGQSISRIYLWSVCHKMMKNDATVNYEESLKVKAVRERNHAWSMFWTAYVRGQYREKESRTHQFTTTSSCLVSCHGGKACEHAKCSLTNVSFWEIMTVKWCPYNVLQCWKSNWLFVNQITFIWRMLELRKWLCCFFHSLENSITGL